MRPISIVVLLDSPHVVQIITTEEEGRSLVEQWRAGQMKSVRYGTDITGRHWAFDPARIVGIVTNPLSDDDMAKLGDLLPLNYRPNAPGQPYRNPAQVWSPRQGSN